MIASDPCRVAIAGCGAVSQLYYAPALAALSGRGVVELVGAFDPNRAKSDAITKQHSAARTVDGMMELLALDAELVIVASPPHAHAEQAIAALQSGANVLCEKPFAPSLDAARAMVAVAARTGRSLTVGHVRRQFPSALAIRDILKSGLIGDIRAISCFEGGRFEWPIASAAYFSRSISGGGVLQDLGPHCFDLLTWWLGPPLSHGCADDAMGGVDANCRIQLDYGSFTAEIRLSRDWPRPNVYRVQGARGRIEWVPSDAETLTIYCAGRPQWASIRLGSAHRQAASLPFHVHFERQIVGAIAAGRGEPGIVPGGEEALPIVALVEACQRDSRPMAMPWLSEAEQRRSASLRGNGAQ